MQEGFSFSTFLSAKSTAILQSLLSGATLQRERSSRYNSTCSKSTRISSLPSNRRVNRSVSSPPAKKLHALARRTGHWDELSVRGYAAVFHTLLRYALSLVSNRYSPLFAGSLSRSRARVRSRSALAECVRTATAVLRLRLYATLVRASPNTLRLSLRSPTR